MTPQINLQQGILSYHPLGAKLPIGPNYEEVFERIMLSEIGHFSEVPFEGVGMRQMLNGSPNMGKESLARERLKLNGWTVRNVQYLQNGKFEVDALPPSKI